MNLENRLKQYLSYLERGIPLTKLHGIVDPGICTCFAGEKCKHKGKHPLKKNWKQDLIRTQQDLEEHFKEFPNSNLAVATFATDDLLVLDFDVKSGGLESLNKLQTNFGELPSTPTSKTGGGGFHYLFRCDPNIKHSLEFNLADYHGLDILTKHNAVAPGSKHHSGNEYKFIDEKSIEVVPIAALPEALVKLFSKNKIGSQKTFDLNQIPEGKRNSTLYKKAASMFSSGISEDFVRETLQEINRNQCNPHLELDEIDSIITSAKNTNQKQQSLYVFDAGNTLFCPSGAIEDAKVICNFQAVLSEQIEIDDGAEGPKDMRYKIDLLHPNILRRPIVVTPAELEDGSWVAKTDASLIVYGVKTYGQHLRVQLRELGNVNNRKKIFINLGWNKVDGKTIYLANNGAITKDGFTSDYFTSPEFGGPIGYEISTTESEIERRSIFCKIQKLLNVTKRKFTTALLAAAFRAPLIKYLPTDFCLGVFGITGSQKSTLVALFTNFFGRDFNYNNLPESFGSTHNAIERKSFLTYACIIVIDDWVPGEHSKYKADYILRSVGNRQGRGRLNSDTSLKKTYSPRSFVILTGEDIQVEQSLRARMIVLAMEKNSVDLELLTELQDFAENGDFNKFMGDYIQWIISNEDCLEEKLKSLFKKYRLEFQKDTKHARIAPNLAHLMLGIELFAEFCVAKNLMNVDEHEFFIAESKLHLGDLKEIQNSHQESTDPVNIFCEILRTILTNGTAHIRHPNPIELGSLFRSIGYTHVSQFHTETAGECIGEFKNGYMCLIKTATFGKVKQYAFKHGIPFNFSERAIGDRLKDRGLLATDEGRTTVKRAIGQTRERCWEFSNWMEVLMPEIAPNAPIAPVKNLIHVVKDGEELNKKTSDGTTSNQDLH